MRLGREAVIVGNAAMTFTTNFELPDVKRAPTPDEVRSFVDDYSAARSSPLSRSQREQISACATLLAAHTARCEHALRNGSEAAGDPYSFSPALQTYGDAYLRP